MLGLVQRLFGVGDGLDHVAAFAEAGVEVMTEQGFVLDHQQFHVRLLDLPIARAGLSPASRLAGNRASTG
ncbi:hypothetical protein D3C77_802070 [compost metagenome]